MYKVYYLRNSLNNEVFYVGYTKNLFRRLADHIKEASEHQKLLEKGNYILNFMNSGGFPIIKVLEFSNSLKEAQEIEIFYIREFHKSFKLFNISSGGAGTTGVSRPSKKRIRVCKINPKTLLVEETYESIAIASELTGISSADIGNCCSGKRFSARKYFWCKEKDFINFKPIYNLKKGYKTKKKIEKYDLNNNLIETYSSITEAALLNNLSISKICNASNGQQKTSGGFKWKQIK